MLVLGAAATGLLCSSIPAIAQTKAIFNNPKKKTSAPAKPVAAQTTEPPRLLSVPENTTPTATRSEPKLELAAAGDKSEVQRQLEMLYEQDGREMPDLNMNMQLNPGNTQQGTAAPANTAPAPAGRSPQVKPLPAQSRSVLGFNPIQTRTQASQYPAQPAQLPASQPGSQAPRNYGAAFDAQAATPTQPQQPAPQQSPAPSRNPVANFFKKMTGGNKTTTAQAPVPPDYSNQAASQLPQIPPSSRTVMPPVQMGANPNALPQMATRPMPPAQQMTPAVRPVQQPVFSTAGLNSRQNPATVQNISTVTTVQADPIRTAPALPTLHQDPVVAPIILPVIPSALPPLHGEPIAQITQPATTPIAQAPTTVIREPMNDFPDPFPEGAESAVDHQVKSLPKAAAVAGPAKAAPQVAVKTEKVVESEETIVIETPTVVAEAPQPEAETEATSTPPADEDPFAVEAKDFSEPVITDKTPQPAAPVDPKSETPSAPASAPELTAPPVLSVPTTDELKPAVDPTPVATPGTSPTLTPPSTEKETFLPPVKAEDQHLEKMRRIRERFGMKGLKGFCPVTLHDERDLVDARPEFNFTYRSQKFHFASVEARDKFEADPSRYAPAAYGADVVALSRDKDVVEGTLDFAAWFKGRLYLFGNQANYDTFIASPAKFATLSGIE